MSTHAAPEPDDAPLDPAAGAAILADQRERVIAAMQVSGRLLFGVWGMSWLIGFGIVWLADTGRIAWGPQPALTAFAVLTGVSLLVTGVHVARRSAGVVGVSARQGAMYGWAWVGGFLVVFTLNGSIAAAGASPDVMRVVTTVVPCLVVALMYMAGGAIWGDRVQFALGAWISVVTAAGAVAGGSTLYLVMALAGGGGFLVGAVAAHVLRVRGRRAAVG